jgi:hypothetical protein
MNEIPIIIHRVTILDLEFYYITNIKVNFSLHDFKDFP